MNPARFRHVRLAGTMAVLPYPALLINGPAGRRQEPELSDTEGCIRMADEDIKELKETTERLETFDPKEKEERFLYVENDLEGELRYSDRESIKYDWIRFGGILNAIIITPKK